MAELMKIRVTGNGYSINSWRFEDAETGNILPVTKFVLRGEVGGDHLVTGILHVLIAFADIETTMEINEHGTITDSERSEG